MARPEAWQLIAENYPVSIVTQTRFQDIDPNRHLNNVAFASMFENARVRLNRALRPWGDRPKNERSMVAVVTINYLREGQYPDDAPTVRASRCAQKSSQNWRRCEPPVSAFSSVLSLHRACQSLEWSFDRLKTNGIRQISP